MRPHWLLLRGLAREALHWGQFPAQLSQALGGAPVAAVDLPGAGEARHLRSPLQIRHIVHHCRLAAPGPGPYAIIGLSMGGMVAAAWAQAYPQEVCGCVLVNSSLAPWAPLHWRLQPGAWPVVMRLVTSWHQPAAQAMVLRLTSAKPKVHAGALPAWQAWAAQRPVSRANALRQLLAAARCRLPALPPAPALLLASRGDRLVDWRSSHALAAAWPGAWLRLHDTAGHDLPLDDSPWVKAQVVNWARRVGLA